MFGYGFGLSDVRVTLANKREEDCLQKIFPIGRHLAAGFAGSVAIGFDMIAELRRLMNYQNEHIACDPEAVAREWPGQAKAVFDRAAESERALHSHVMLICAHPQLHNGNPNLPRCYVMICRSPRFEVEHVRVHNLGSIGSGSTYERCRAEIERFAGDFRFRETLMQGETGRSGGMGTMIGINLTNTLQEARVPGVSPHLHYCWVYRGRTVIQRNDHTTKGRWSIIPLGSGKDAESITSEDLQRNRACLPEGYSQFQMPEIATTREELNILLQSRGLSAAGCTA
jgi:ATP-dependent protease HslVU (ClpYQ) peptidase subunit